MLTSTKFERELRDTANMKADANRRCVEEHWWKELCSKALARGTDKSVFVITTGKAEALKFTNLGTAPCSLPVSVEDMGPNGLGDAQVNDDDIVLLFNGHNHYNGLVSASITGAAALCRDGRGRLRLERRSAGLCGGGGTGGGAHMRTEPYEHLLQSSCCLFQVWSWKFT